jgi:hypothetical protein
LAAAVPAAGGTVVATGGLTGTLASHAATLVASMIEG